MKHVLLQIAKIATTLAACLSLPALAQDSQSAPQKVAEANIAAVETAAKQPQPDQAQPALWKISDDDTTIYLFGTIHVLPDGINWFEGKVAQAFAASESLVTEIVGGDPAEMQGLVVNMAMLPASKSLRSQLTGEKLAAYEAALARYGIPPELFDRFEPWYAAIALSTVPLMQAGFDAEHGVENLLEDKAQQRSLAHIGLETSAYQLGLFDGLPMAVQERYLGEVIEQLPTLKTDINAMVEAWKGGNAAELARLMNAAESDPVLVKTLLIDRNKAWAQWLQQRMDKPGTVFVAVGAGHLAGPGSVQDQLSALKIHSCRLQ